MSDLPEYITLEELSTAAAKARPDISLFLWFLWLTGARISEALAIKFSDLDHSARLVRLPTLKRRAPVKRTMPLPDTFLASLARLRGPESSRVFHWSRQHAYSLCRAALEAAGVLDGRAHPHAIRHGHGVHAAMNGAPVSIIQRALGHASSATTDIYLRVTAQDVRRDYDRMDWGAPADSL